MKPVEFKGCNARLGSNQEEYESLPAIYLPVKTGDVVSCWELDDDELREIIETKKVYLVQLTCGNPYQANRMSPKLEDLI
jgi:hypothetical protein